MVFVVAFLAAAANASPILRLLITLKSRQTVSQYLEGHQVKQGTPTMGGLIVIVGFVVGGLGYGLTLAPTKALLTIGLFIGFALIGFVDDFVVPRYVKGKRGLGWKQKILMQCVVTVPCVGGLVGDFGNATWVAVFLVLFFSNAYNFADGLDGLAGLLLIGLGTGLEVIAHARHAEHFEPFLFALLGAILPFLYLNKPKAKVFMGDVGSLPIGALLGLAFAVLALPNDFDAFYSTVEFAPGYTGGAGGTYTRPLPDIALYWALFLASGMMIVELVPVPLQILSVKIRKKKLFSFTPIHHAYERKGWREIKVVAVFVGIQVALSIVAVLISAKVPVVDAEYPTGKTKFPASTKWHHVSSGGPVEVDTTSSTGSK